MENDQQTLENKLIICTTAAKLYMQHDGNITFHQIADHTEFSVAEILSYFCDTNDIIRFYYSSLIIRYRLMIEEIDDFNSYTISEKMSNFVYTTFDMMAEQELFVQATFKKQILCGGDFKSRLRQLAKDFLDNDGLISASSSYLLNDCSYHFLQHKYFMLVLFWLHDKSEDKEMTMELTDKLTGLLQELVYSSAVDRGADLVKFMYSNHKSIFNHRLISKLSSTFKMQ